MSRPWILVPALSILGTASCGAWLASVRSGGNGTNPDQTEAVRASARPATPVAIIDCFDDLSYQGRSTVDRKDFEAAVVPELWRGIGGTGEARHQRASGAMENVCSDVEKRLFQNREWTLGPASKRWIGSVAGPDTKSLIFASYNFPPKCTGVQETVRDDTGRVIATVDTDKRKCVENGFTWIQIVWVTADGVVLGKMEDRCDNWGESRCGKGYEKAGEAVDFLMSFLGPKK